MSRLTGLVRFVRAPHVRARALAVADSRAAVRAAFLASAEQLGLVDALAGARLDLDGVARVLGVPPGPQLAAWLRVGVELGELRARGGLYRLHGARSCALAAGDEVLRAHYRSFLEYQMPTYGQLGELLAGRRRSDLSAYAATIAEVSRAAEPFVATWLERVLRTERPARLLDVGCGTGVYLEAAARAVPGLRALGVDREAAVVDGARARLAAAGLSDRVEVRCDDARDLDVDVQFDAVTLLNGIYYFPPADRPHLLRSLGAALRPGGLLVVATMVVPGSIAAAHLDLMLRVQDGEAALPTRKGLHRDLKAAGYRKIRIRPLVPTEPFLGFVARRD